MYLIAGILPIALVIVVILHLLVFRRGIKWMSWTVLILVSAGLIALLGFGGLHAGLAGLLTFIIGFFWLKFGNKEVKNVDNN